MKNNSVADAGALSTIGLSKAEALAYETIVRLGPSTTGTICAESGIRSSHIYAILGELLKKGLVSYHLRRNVKVYEATPPAVLKRLYDEKKAQVLSEERRVSALVARLTTLQKITDTQSDVRVFEGLSGIKSSVERMLDALGAGDTYYVLGSPLVASKQLNAYFQDVHERRLKKRIAFKIIYNADALSFAKDRRKQRLTQVRVLDVVTPTEFAIYADTVQIVIFSRKPIVLEIKNPEVAASFLAYFDVMWRQSRKI